MPPSRQYGLDTITVWPHLWLLLPETTCQELRAIRTSLDTAVAAATWGLLFCVFTPFTPWQSPSTSPWPPWPSPSSSRPGTGLL
jgi:hypothetical protein